VITGTRSWDTGPDQRVNLNANEGRICLSFALAFFWVVDSIAWVVSFLCAWMIFSSLLFLWMDERLSRGLTLIPL